MRKIAWSPKFIRAFKRLVRQNPQMRSLIEQMQQLAEDPFQPIKAYSQAYGDLSGIWACSIDYSNRIVFEFVKNLEDEEEAFYY